MNYNEYHENREYDEREWQKPEPIDPFAQKITNITLSILCSVFFLIVLSAIVACIAYAIQRHWYGHHYIKNDGLMLIDFYISTAGVVVLVGTLLWKFGDFSPVNIPEKPEYTMQLIEKPITKRPEKYYHVIYKN